MKSTNKSGTVTTSTSDFEAWMLEVDEILIDRLGLASDALPDQDYVDLFESELTPKACVAAVILTLNALEDDEDEFKGQGGWGG